MLKSVRKLREKKLNDAAPPKQDGWVTEVLAGQGAFQSRLRMKDGCVAELLAIGERIKNTETSHRATLYNQLANGYAVAVFLREDDEAWSELCSSHIWNDHPRKRPSIGKRQAILSTALTLMHGIDDGDRKKLSLHKRALQSAFDSNISPADIPKYIRDAGGLEALARRKADSDRLTLRDDHLYLAIPRKKTAKTLAAVGIGTVASVKLKYTHSEDGVMFFTGGGAEIIEGTSKNAGARSDRR